MFQCPLNKEVSLGENNKRILYMSEKNESQVIYNFKQCGGKVMNPLYLPPTERKQLDYSENEQINNSILQILMNIYSKSLSFLKSHVPEEVIKSNCSLSHCAFNNNGTKMATLFPDGAIRIYDLEKQQWESVKIDEKNQICVHSISWKPDSHNTLAVGCKNGVYIWSHSDCVFYRIISSMSSILSVDYSPCGQFLAVTRKNDCSVYIYNTVDYHLLTTLTHITTLPIKVAFSPDSALLAVLQTNNQLSIYHTLTWKEEKWSLNSVTDFAFSGNSEYIYVCCRVSNRDVLYTIQVSHQSYSMYSSMNFSTITLSSPTESEHPVKKIVVDPRGCRLVCSHEHSNVLSVYSIQNSTQGFLNNPIEDNEVKELYFVPWKEAGSLVCVVWKSGHVLFYHLLY